MPQRELENDEVSILDIFSFLYALRSWFFIALILAIVSAGAFVSFLIINGDDSSEFSIKVQFTFPGSSEGKYPDGTDFFPSHLLSSPIIDRVIKENNLKEKYNINNSDLLSMLSFDFESESTRRLVLNFQDELASLKSRKAPFNHISEFTADFEKQLERNATGNRRLILSDHLGVLPNGVVKKILFDIPKIWSDFYVRNVGVTSSDLPMYNSELIDPSKIADFDYPIAVDILSDALARTEAYSAKINEISGSNIISDRDTGWFLGDIFNQILVLKRFEIDEKIAPLANLGLSRDLDFTPVLYADKLKQLEFNKEKLIEIRASLSNLLENHEVTENIGTTAEKVELSGDFLDKIVDLTNSNNAQKLTNSFKTQLLEIDAAVAENNRQKNNFEERLRALTQLDSFPTGTGLTRENAEKIMEESIPEITGRINLIWGAIHRIRLAAERQYDATNGVLYSVNTDRIVPGKISPLVSRQNLLMLTAIGFVVFFLVLLIGVIKRLARSVKRA